MRIRLAVAFPFVVGIFLGTLITTFLLLAVQSIDEETPLQRARDVAGEEFAGAELGGDLPYDMSDEDQVQTDAPTLSPSRLASYNVLTSKATLKDRGFAIHRTWGGEKAIQGTMEYYVYPRAGKEEIDFAAARKMHATSLEQEEESKEMMADNQGIFELWKNICETKLEKYQWFVKLRDDVYLRRMSLTKLLSSLNSSEPLLVGRAIFPSGRVREDLGLREGDSHCHEACYILSWKAVKMLCPKLETCQENARSTNEDVEIARCMKTHLQVNCTAATEVSVCIHGQWLCELCIILLCR